MFIRFTKFTLKTLAALLASLGALYVVLLLINLNDQAPSADANTLRHLLENATPDFEQTAENNGYLFLIEHENAPELRVSEQLSALMRECNLADCNSALMAQSDLEAILAQHQHVVDFYKKALDFSNWYEPEVTDPMQAFANYRSLLNAQQLVLMQAWLAAKQHDIVAVKQILLKDINFWRSRLSKHTILNSKAISTAAIKRHFEYSAVIRRQFNIQQLEPLSIPSWHLPFTEEELSLLPVMAGEWVYGYSFMESVVDSEIWSEDLTTVEKMVLLLGKPLYQKQANRNLHASRLLTYTRGQQLATPPWYSWLYNPVGRLMFGSDTLFSYNGYRSRLKELETLRQQAVAPMADKLSLQ